MISTCYLFAVSRPQPPLSRPVPIEPPLVCHGLRDALALLLQRRFLHRRVAVSVQVEPSVLPIAAAYRPFIAPRRLQGVQPFRLLAGKVLSAEVADRACHRDD